MRRTATIAVLFVVATACGVTGSDPTTTTTAQITTTSPGFAVTVTDDQGPVTIEDRPEAIISLSATATEMLYAVGAGAQVGAVDDQSDYPEEAPRTDLSGFTPNLEAILAHQPDLVIISFDPADNPITEGLESVGVPVLLLAPAVTIDDVYRQIEVIGLATGNGDAAASVSEDIKDGLSEIVEEWGDAAQGVSYYHELDSTLFSVTSSTFIGEIYSLLGMVNIADAADPEGASFGYPQLSSEYVVSTDPDIIFLADTEFGESLQTLSARPGWGGMTAVQSEAVVALDADIASRWGPRIVEFLQAIADAVAAYSPVGAG